MVEIRNDLEKKELILEYFTPITESAQVNDDFIIKGVAINAVTTLNNHTFLEEEMKPAAISLKGVPLLVDHNNSVESIKGRVFESNFNPGAKRIEFSAVVKDKKIKEMIIDGRLNSVSVGATVKEVEEGENGNLIPRGIKFHELSLVAVPADDGATFTTSLNEAFEKSHSIAEMPKIETNTSIKEVKNMKEELQTNQEVEEMKSKLEEQEKQLKEYKAKERAELEKSYEEKCNSKKGKGLNISELSDVTLKLLMEQLDTIEVEEPKEEEVKAEPVTEESEESEEENEEEVAEESAKFVQMNGSLKGGAFTIKY